MTAFTKIGIIGIHANPLVQDTVAHLLEQVQLWGYEVLVETKTAQYQNIAQAQVVSDKQLGQDCDVVIAVGGDGNLLHAGRVLSLTGTPVIGINRGKLGFLTDIAPSQLTTKLRAMLAGDYLEEHRFLVTGSINDGPSHNALNDVVLFAGGAAQLVEFEVFIDNQFVYRQRSDGLIVATPTGSTAYALSAGGPIVAPYLNVLLLVPKYPHNLNTRPLIIDADLDVKIHIGAGHILPSLSFDGHSTCGLAVGDVITISKQAKPLRLLHPKHHDYYHTLRHKLGWANHMPAPEV